MVLKKDTRRGPPSKIIIKKKNTNFYILPKLLLN